MPTSCVDYYLKYLFPIDYQSFLLIYWREVHPISWSVAAVLGWFYFLLMQSFFKWCSSILLTKCFKYQVPVTLYFSKRLYWCCSHIVFFFFFFFFFRCWWPNMVNFLMEGFTIPEVEQVFIMTIYVRWESSIKYFGNQRWNRQYLLLGIKVYNLMWRVAVVTWGLHMLRLLSKKS